MIKLAFAVVALTWFYGQASAASLEYNYLSHEEPQNSHSSSEEEPQSLETCLLRIPPAASDADLSYVANTTHWYMKYSDDISRGRLLQIALPGTKGSSEEIQALLESPCMTAVNEPYIDGVTVSEVWTSGTLGEGIPVRTTFNAGGVTVSKLKNPNTLTVAETLHWVPVLTNGKTFVLLFACLSDGHFGFFVFTTVPKLDAYSIHQIKNYMDDAGFGDKLDAYILYRTSQCTNTP